MNVERSQTPAERFDHGNRQDIAVNAPLTYLFETRRPGPIVRRFFQRDDIDPDANDHMALARGLTGYVNQDPAQFRSVMNEVVGPFETDIGKPEVSSASANASPAARLNPVVSAGPRLSRQATDSNKCAYGAANQRRPRRPRPSV